MQRETHLPSDAGGCWRDRVLVVGEAPLPSSLRSPSKSGLLCLAVEIDCDSGTVLSVACRELAPVAEALVAELLVGHDLQEVFEGSVGILRSQYFALTRDALVEALGVAARQFELWKQSNSTGLAPSDSFPQPLDSLPESVSGDSNGEPPADSQVDRSTRHGLATHLVTLLAHARLLDDRERRGLAGRAISREARHQAVQLYAVAQQILHKVETEPGLLQPQIEPVLVPELIHRALCRLAVSGRGLPVEQRLPADLPPARGDPIVLEEALVLLFDGVAGCVDSAQTLWEVAAERRKTDMLVSIQLRSDRAGTEGEPIPAFPRGTDDDPLAGSWEGNLGILAARALVEHQGGRLWFQETFPQDGSCLCLSLATYSPQEDLEYRLSSASP